MAASRTATHSLRALRTVRPSPILTSRQIVGRRFQSSTSGARSDAKDGNDGMMSALLGGMAGGALVFLAGYTYYSFSGIKTAVSSLHQTKAYFDSAAKKLSEATPEPNEALDWLRDTATSYSAFIPGARGYVETAFKDLDAVRAKHGDEVDKIVRDAYDEIKEVSKSKGASVETAQKVWDILQRRLKDVANLAGDAMEDIMNNHPEIKDKVGGNIDQLREMGKSLGPEAQKQIDETWNQVSGIVSKIGAGGFGMGTINEIKKLVQEKSDQLKKLGEQAYEKGLEQAKPYLDKNPKIKELVENNADVLKAGNVGQLWEKVKDAANSGDLGDLQKFVDQAKDKSKSMGIDLEKYMQMIPGGSEIMPKLQQLQDIGQKHGKEAQDLLSSTIEEVKQVLEKKVGDAQKLADKASKDAK